MPTPLENALSVDISVLVNLLSRNWCAHRQTLYFQRTSMVVRALQRCDRVRDRMRSLKASLKKLQQKSKQEEWVMLGHDQHESLLEQELLELHEIVVKGFPEILSRIQHASAALLVEIARGFFMPLCTVAIAALARIRVLVMRLGREGLTDLQDCWRLLQNGQETIITSPDWFATAMKVFVEVDTDASLAEIQRQARERTRESLGMQLKAHTKTTGEQSSPMEHVSKKTTSTVDAVKEHEGLVANEPISRNASKELCVVQEDDIGESVDVSDIGNAAGVKEPLAAKSDIVGDPSSHSDQPEMDMNMDFVRKLQAKTNKDRDKNQKTKKKRKSGGEQEPREKGKKKKKRKKESKRKDVLDEIFGDL